MRERRTATVAVTSSAVAGANYSFPPLIDRPYLPRNVRFQEAAMKDLSEVQQASIFTRKRIAVAIAILTICALALWASLEMVLRMTSGQS